MSSQNRTLIQLGTKHKFIGSALAYVHCTKEHLEEVVAKLEK